MKERLKNFRQLISKKRLDGFLITNERSIFYFTGASGGNLLLVPKEGEYLLYVYGVNYEGVKAEAKNCRVELIKSGEKPEEKLLQQIERHKIRNLGFDSLPVTAYLGLRKLLRKRKVKLKPKGELVWELRKIKDEEELALIRKAAEITSKGMDVAYEFLRPGMQEIEVAAEIEYAMRKAGSWGLAFENHQEGRACSRGHRSHLQELSSRHDQDPRSGKAVKEAGKGVQHGKGGSRESLSKHPFRKKGQRHRCGRERSYQKGWLR